MSENQASAGSPNGESLKEKLLRGSVLADSNAQEAIPILEAVQKDVVAVSLFSQNETLEDVSTKTIPFLALEHLLAIAYTNLPASPGKIVERKSNILKCCDLWAAFLGRLERLEQLTKEEEKEFHELLEETDISKPMPVPNRDIKIAKFKAQQEAKKEAQQLKALRERRGRMGMAADEEVDGHDEESLERSIFLKQLELQKSDALEQWASSKRELPMIEMMVKMEEERKRTQKHQGGPPVQDTRPPPNSGKPLQLTQVTKSATGQLQFNRSEVRSKVFQPGWNQPTMSLEELGEREYHEAMEREERSKLAEAENMNKPRRYKELVRDGMEDNKELVDASAKLDRDWDDWKDQNPRGSGNKHAMRGDKNF
ncbi:unnamed protein product [Cylindrotheca closterium]|uniref:TAP42-like protein n=1 Tax=Cylindrotheca closterium TaxID=2856 RepID=A0AAD2FAW0_9STRA|nr:unnamed protein product [Cylindrotheca closterium]